MAETTTTAVFPAMAAVHATNERSVEKLAREPTRPDVEIRAEQVESIAGTNPRSYLLCAYSFDFCFVQTIYNPFIRIFVTGFVNREFPSFRTQHELKLEDERRMAHDAKHVFPRAERYHNVTQWFPRRPPKKTATTGVEQFQRTRLERYRQFRLMWSLAWRKWMGYGLWFGKCCTVFDSDVWWIMMSEYIMCVNVVRRVLHYHSHGDPTEICIQRSN